VVSTGSVVVVVDDSGGSVRTQVTVHRTRNVSVVSVRARASQATPMRIEASPSESVRRLIGQTSARHTRKNQTRRNPVQNSASWSRYQACTSVTCDHLSHDAEHRLVQPRRVRSRVPGNDRDGLRQMRGERRFRAFLVGLVPHVVRVLREPLPPPAHTESERNDDERDADQPCEVRGHFAGEAATTVCFAAPVTV
jgi:hypothetical protein